MSKPKVFISSTIYDFADLRSSLRYWLAEAGFDVQMSERPDFDKNSSHHSYDACLNAIPECDFFILLIGSRVGGWYDKYEKTVSITRKECRTAYDCAISTNKPTRIITFVRQCVWDVKEDRKGLITLLKDTDTRDLQNPILLDNLNKLKKGDYDSNVLRHSEHIRSFIDEIGSKASFNWINIFNDFSDVLNVLENELKVKTNVSVRVAEQGIRSAVLDNLRWLCDTKNGITTSFFQCFRPIHDTLKMNKNNINQVPGTAIMKAGDFFINCRNKAGRLNTSAFDDAVLKGTFLEYNNRENAFMNTGFNQALIDVSDEINRLNEAFTKKYSSTWSQNAGASTGVIFKTDSGNLEVFQHALLPYNMIYIHFVNIFELSKYILDYIKNHDANSPYPILLNYTKNARPSEEEILHLLQE